MAPIATLFQNIVVCVEEWVDPLKLAQIEASTIAQQRQKEVRRNDDYDAVVFDEAPLYSAGELNEEPEARIADEGEQQLPGFLQDIVDVLSVLRFGSHEFLEYIQTEDIRREFDESKHEE